TSTQEEKDYLLALALSGRDSLTSTPTSFTSTQEGMESILPTTTSSKVSLTSTQEGMESILPTTTPSKVSLTSTQEEKDHLLALALSGRDSLTSTPTSFTSTSLSLDPEEIIKNDDSITQEEREYLLSLFRA